MPQELRRSLVNPIPWFIRMKSSSSNVGVLDSTNVGIGNRDAVMVRLFLTMGCLAWEGIRARKGV